jgi:hypothetical protein
MKPEELAGLLREAVKISVQKTLEIDGIAPVQLTPAAAYRKYGRTNVERWLREQLIRFQSSKESPRKLLDSHRLEAIAASSNRHTYLPVAER